MSLFLASCGSGIFKMTDSNFTPAYPEHLIERLYGKIGGNGQVDHYAIIIGANTEMRHRNTISFAYQILLERGYLAKNVFILDSASRTPIFPKIDFTTYDSIRQLFWHISRVVEKHDTLLVYVTGHGNRIKDEPYLMLNEGEHLDPESLLKLIDDVKPRSGMLFLDQCYWGQEFKPEGCEWTTITVSTTTTTSSGDMFPRLFWSYFRGKDRDLVSIESAFLRAKREDKSTQKKENHPEITVGSCFQSYQLPIEKPGDR